MSDHPSKHVGTKALKRRWVMLALFSFVSFANNMVWATYSPVQVLAMKYFRVSATSINWMSLIYMAAYIPGSLVANVMLDWFGLGNYLIVAACFNVVGGWIRVAGSYQPELFPLLFAGQTLCAICQCFIFSAPNVIAAVWFPDQERTLCVSIAIILNQLGSALGYLFSPYLITQDNYKNSFIFVAILQSIIVSATGVAQILWFESKPPIPPSASAMTKNIQMKQDANRRDMKQVILNQLKEAIQPLLSINFWILLHALGTCQGIFGAVATILNQVIIPYGFTTEDAGWFGFCLIAASLPMVLFSGYFVDRTKWYSYSTKANAVLFTISYLILILSLEVPFLRKRPIIYIACSLFGSFCNSALPIYLETGVEVTYPVPEGLSSSYQIIATQLYGVVITMLMTAMFESKVKKYTLWASLAFCGLSTILTFFFHGRMKRLEMESKVVAGEYGIQETSSLMTKDIQA